MNLKLVRQVTIYVFYLLLYSVCLFLRSVPIIELLFLSLEEHWKGLPLQVLLDDLEKQNYYS